MNWHRVSNFSTSSDTGDSTSSTDQDVRLKAIKKVTLQLLPNSINLFFSFCFVLSNDIFAGDKNIVQGSGRVIEDDVKEQK